MLQDAHARKISIPVAASVGTTDIIAAQDDAWIYVHELIGDLASAGNLTIKCGYKNELAFYKNNDAPSDYSKDNFYAEKLYRSNIGSIFKSLQSVNS